MSHGGNIHKAARERGDGEIIDLSASINPLGPSPKARSAMRRALELCAHYPDPDSYEMTRAISSRYNIDPSRLLCGNGSTELIFLSVRALAPKTVLIAGPTFSEYAHAAAAAGARLKQVTAHRRDGYVPRPDAFIKAMSGTDMAFLCNPGNPTGTLIEREEVLRIVKAAEAARCMLVVDEAFMDFCPSGSVLDIESPYLAVIRSLTKFYALAGLRAGFGVFPQRMIRKLRLLKEPWSINTPAQMAAAASLADTNYIERTRRLIGTEKAYLESEFRRLSIRHYPSDVNYYLLEIADAKRVTTEIAARGIIVRDCSDFRGLDRRHIRVAVRTRRENALLIAGLGDATSGEEGYECRS